MRKALKREILDCINSLHQEIREALEEAVKNPVSMGKKSLLI